MEKTFAERARALKKKYKRAEYDEVEKKELIEELRKLRDEQESFRADAGMGEESENEVEQYDGTGSSFLPYTQSYKAPSFSSGLPGAQYNQEMLNRIAPNKFQGATTPRWNTTIKGGESFSAVPQASGQSSIYGPIKSSILSSAISTGVSLVGNIAGMIGANKSANESAINIPRIAAEQISLAPQREDLRRSANTATNVALRNSRDVSSPGAAYANQVAGVGSIYDSLGSAMGQSYMTEQNTNAQMRQQANEANLSSQLRGNMFNAQMKASNQEQADQYRDAAFQAIPQGLQDFRAQRSQDQWMSQMGKDYGLYQRNDPNATFGDKLYNSLFGSPYEVNAREYMNSLNRRR